MANETEIVEVRLPILPKGYRYTGEYRYAQQGELIMPRDDVFPWERVVESDCLHHIIEKIKWVPRLDEPFFYIDYTGDIKEVSLVSQSSINSFVGAGNYFKTRGLAQNAADAMKAMFKELPHE